MKGAGNEREGRKHQLQNAAGVGSLLGVQADELDQVHDDPGEQRTGEMNVSRSLSTHPGLYLIWVGVGSLALAFAGSAVLP